MPFRSLSSHSPSNLQANLTGFNYNWLEQVLGDEHVSAQAMVPPDSSSLPLAAEYHKARQSGDVQLRFTLQLAMFGWTRIAYHNETATRSGSLASPSKLLINDHHQLSQLRSPDTD